MGRASHVNACAAEAQRDILPRKVLPRVLVIMLLALCVAFCSGCRFSDLRAIAYYDPKGVVDPHIEIPVPDRIADRMREDVQPTKRNDAERTDERQQTIPDEDEGDDPTPSPQVNPGATLDDAPSGNAADPDNPNTQPTGDIGSGTAPSSNPDQAQDQQGSAQDPQQGNQDDSSQSNNQEQDDNQGGANGSGVIFDARYGAPEDLPTCKTVVAAGGLSEVAAVLGGVGDGGALVGATQDFASKAESIFGSIPVSFSGDGMYAGSVDIDEIIALEPEGVMIPNGCSAFSEDDLNRLRNADIDIVLLPSMSSASGMRTCVDLLGRVIDSEAAPSGMSARETADAYLEFFDRVMNEAMDSHGGGWSDYSFDSLDPGYGDPNVTTLLIDGWDGGAIVSANAFPSGGQLFSDQGVAYAKRGYAASPASTFLSAGGVTNNAALASLYWGASGNIIPMLQINENFLGYQWENTSFYISGGSGMSGSDHVLTRAANGLGVLGQEGFPAVIVRDESVASNLDAARNESTGLYVPGQMRGDGEIGIYFDGEFIPVLALPDYDIYVNPAGFLGSWIDGGMESVIESTWAASMFNGYSGDDVSAQVQEFYSTFYGYELSGGELEDILSGAYAD